LRWGEIKRIFSKAYLKSLGRGENQNESHQKRGEAVLWQRRFWEHTIRDMDDYQRHVEYIHYNPVKHGMVENVSDWQWSSFHRYVKMGLYEMGWGDNYRKSEVNVNFGE
jgi:putative transposase